MSQREEIQNIMSKLQNYARIPNGIITASEIEMAFRNYQLEESEKNKEISENDKKQISSMIEEKTSEKKCSYNYEPINEGWNFFQTNGINGGNTDYQWKVYIPVKLEHYGFVVKNIIAFLCDKGIVSSCKFSGTMRSDSMIVNLENDEDVTALNEYISNTKSLGSCLGKHQPFIPDFNGIGVVHGYDAETSYTERLSKYLAHYVNTCKSQNRIDLINAESFLSSMKNALDNNMVQKPEEIEQIVEHMDIIMNGKNYIQYDSENRTQRF